MPNGSSGGVRVSKVQNPLSARCLNQRIASEIQMGSVTIAANVCRDVAAATWRVAVHSGRHHIARLCCRQSRKIMTTPAAAGGSPQTSVTPHAASGKTSVFARRR